MAMVGSSRQNQICGSAKPITAGCFSFQECRYAFASRAQPGKRGHDFGHGCTADPLLRIGAIFPPL